MNSRKKKFKCFFLSQLAGESGENDFPMYTNKLIQHFTPRYAIKATFTM